MKPTYILGDHHGDYEAMFAALEERGIGDARIIHVGDGGEGFPDWRAATAESLDSRFAAFGIEYLSIRGNHSDPAFFDGRVMLPNFKLLRDSPTLHLNGQSWIGPSCRNELVRACANAEALFGCDTLIAELEAERRAHERLFPPVKPKSCPSPTPPDNHLSETDDRLDSPPPATRQQSCGDPGGGTVEGTGRFAQSCHLKSF
jgi:hypothetical protein